MELSAVNSLDPTAAKELLTTCCGAAAWVVAMERLRPFKDEKDLLEKADACWMTTGENDWLEAFRHHPKIGDLEGLRKKFASTQHLAGAEQAAVQSASESTLQQLADGNEACEKRFGFIIIV